MKLQFFPGQELNMIRREVKQFKDQQEQLLASANITGESEEGSSKVASKKNTAKNADNELQGIREGYDSLVSILQEETQLCERKLDILSNRRQAEEESRLQLLRKLAKMKTIEDQQSRDPSNFRNQSGRF